MPAQANHLPEPLDIGRAVVLASASSYRAQLLAEARITFTVMVSDVDESLQPLTEPAAYAQSLALRKAQSVAAKTPNALVIGADTICAIGNEIIGKPRDAADAEAIILRGMAAVTQRVITGCAIVDSRDMHTVSAAITSLVELRPAPRELVRAYVATGEPMGKCGALCIEGGHGFVRKFEGSYSNIMGLPLEWLVPKVLEMARR